MDGDLQQLYEYIGDLHNKQMMAFADFAQEQKEFNGGIGVRVKTMEDIQSKQDTRQWIHTAVIIPVLALLHGIGHHFGWKI